MRTIASLLTLILLSSSAFATHCGTSADKLAVFTGPLFNETKMIKFVGERPMDISYLYSNPETGTWTWAFEPKPGVLCTLSSGVKFEVVKPAKEGEPL